MKIQNPIIDARIVSDITFATRLKSFLEHVQVNDAMSQEEQQYLLRVSEKLLEYQKTTANKATELIYFQNIDQAIVQVSRQVISSR